MDLRLHQRGASAAALPAAQLRRILGLIVLGSLAVLRSNALGTGATGLAVAGDASDPAALRSVVDRTFDVAQVQGQVHAQAVRRVGELAERNPNETASIVRQWLSEPAE